MKEFKVGDKVKVISDSYCNAFKGSIGIIVKVSTTNLPNFPYDVYFNDGEEPWPFSPNELELVK